MSIITAIFKPVPKLDLQKSASTVVLPSSEEGQWDVAYREEDLFQLHAESEIQIPPANLLHTVFCWSTHDTLTIPIWIAEGGSAEEMIALELELHGITRPGQAASFVLDEIHSSNGRRLFAVHLLKNQDQTCPVPGAQSCDIGVRWLPLREDALHFWIENGCVVYAISRGTKAVYTGSLRTTKPGDADWHAIHRVIERLQAEEVISETLSAAVFFAPFSPVKNKTFLGLFKIPTKKVERKIETVPDTILDLPSRDVVEKRRGSQNSARLQRGLLYAAAIALFLVLVACAFFIGEVIELRHLEKETVAQSEEVNRLVQLARKWQVIEAAADPSFYPVDILRDCAAELPDIGVRLTLFSINGTEVLLEGEAENHPAAFSFAEKIKKSAPLSQYDWEAPQPTLLPNNAARFQIRGVRKPHEATKS